MKTFKILFSFILIFIVFAIKSQTVIYYEDFESKTIPEGWLQNTKAADGGWKFCLASQNSNSRFTIPEHSNVAITNESVCKCNKKDDRLITKSFDFSSYTNLHLSFDSYFVGCLWGDTTETANAYYSKDDGKTWYFLYTFQPSSAWINNIVNITSLAGQTNIKFAFVYNDGGGWLCGTAIDNVKIYIPYSYDVTTTSIDLNDCYRPVPITIKGKFRNLGSTKVTSVIINYQIDNNSIVSQEIKSLNLSSTASYSYSFNTKWEASTFGNHSIKVWVSNINGNTDEYPNNDIYSKETNIYQAGKPLLVEYFTNASCYYCGLYVPGLENNISNNNDFVIGLSYHANWPGNDPMYNTTNSDDFSIRKKLYNVSGVPKAYVDGSEAPAYLVVQNECTLKERTATEPSVIIENIKFSNIYDKANRLSFSADFEALKTLSGNYKFFMAIIERNITFAKAPGTNGQKYFDWVMKKMLPDANGTTLPTSMSAGYKKTFSSEWNYTGTIYNNEQLGVVFFIQNMNTKEILYVALAHKSVDIKDNISNINSFNVFPNPTSNDTEFSISINNKSNVKINIIDMYGKIIDNINPGKINPGIYNFKYNTNKLEQGIYFIDLNANNSVVRKKLFIIK